MKFVVKSNSPMSIARTCHQHQQNGLQSEKDIAWCLLQCRFIIFSYHSVSNKSIRVFATTGKHRLLGQQIVVHWVVNLYEAVVERSKSGRPEKVIFRCKIILILYIFNLGKRVWKAAQKEMKRTANAEKNLQKK